MALLPALLLLVSAALLIRGGQLGVGGLLLGLLAALLGLILPILLGMGLVALIGTLGDGPQPWYAYPLPTRLVLWAGALLCGGLVAAVIVGGVMLVRALIVRIGQRRYR